jgi:hypothetical protein
MEDMQKLVKVLIDNKIITLDKAQAMPGVPAIHAPLMDKQELLNAGTKAAENNPKT